MLRNMVQEDGVSRMHEHEEITGGGTSSTDVPDHQNYDPPNYVVPLVMGLVILVILGLIVLWCTIGCIYYNKKPPEVSPEPPAPVKKEDNCCHCGGGSGGTTTIIVGNGAAWAPTPVWWYRYW